MNIAAVQAALSAAGYACAADGQFGPMTYAALLGYAAARPLGQLGQALGQGIADAFPAFGIASDLEHVHFLAQACHETEGFRYLIELGSPNDFTQYDGRFGNVQPGDGFKYRGRGIFQITFADNYRQYGEMLGEPFLDHPDLVAQPVFAVKTACAFWRQRNCAAPANADDCEGVTRKINGGLTGLADRQAITDRLKAICGR